MCKVLNARQVGTTTAAERVYVGRPTKWGNPFVIGRDGDRPTVIAKHKAWIVRQPALMAALRELRGKDLVCWCAPEACHAETLRDLANRSLATGPCAGAPPPAQPTRNQPAARSPPLAMRFSPHRGVSFQTAALDPRATAARRTPER
jgi:hypothetical protein